MVKLCSPQRRQEESIVYEDIHGEQLLVLYGVPGLWIRDQRICLSKNYCRVTKFPRFGKFVLITQSLLIVSHKAL